MRAIKTKVKRTVYAIALAIIALFSFFFETVVPAWADSSTGNETSYVNYEKTSIMEDLRAAGIDFDYTDTVNDTSPKVILFSEYCYDKAGSFNALYGLYIYVYNPTGTPIREGAGMNVVNMAISYKDGNGKHVQEPTKYANVPLTFLSKTGSVDGVDDYANKFFKFRVEKEYTQDVLLPMAQSYEKMEGVRRYDVAGVQLAFTGESNVKLDTTYARTYRFKGYAKGFGDPYAETSDLTYDVEMLDTVELEVKHTNHRGDFDGWTTSDLNTAYFVIPDKYFEKYGDEQGELQLQAITATWDEYKTTPMFVTSDKDGYDGLYPYIGENIGKGLDGLDWRVIWEIKSGEVLNLDSRFHYAAQSYNGWTKNATDSGVGGALLPFNDWYKWEDSTPLPRMDWLFYREEPDKKEDFSFSSEEVREYMAQYTAKYPEQNKIVGAEGEYAEGLFTASIDENRIPYLDAYKAGDKTAKRGKVTLTIDKDDEKDIVVEKNQSWWKEFWNGKEYTTETLTSIVDLADAENSHYLTMDDETFAEELYVKGEDVAAIKALKTDGHPILFRYAVSEYYASSAIFDLYGNNSFSSEDGYVAQETMFLNFDIISLTFSDEQGNCKVISVVSDPTDVINGLTPAPDLTIEEEPDWTKWFKTIVALLVGVGFISAISPLIPFAANLIVEGVKIPFKIVAWLLEKVRNLFKWIGRGLKKKR